MMIHTSTLSSFVNIYDGGDDISSRLWAIFKTMSINFWFWHFIAPIIIVIVIPGLFMAGDLIDEVGEFLNNEMAKIFKSSTSFVLLLYFSFFSLCIIFILCLYMYIFKLIIWILSYVTGDKLSANDAMALSKIFSQYIYFCKHDFENDLMKSILDIKRKFICVLMYVFVLVMYILLMFSVYNVAKSNFTSQQVMLTFLQKLSVALIPMLYFAIYSYNGLSDAIKLNYDAMAKGLSSNTYMRRTYESKCNEIIKQSSVQSNKYRDLFVLASIIAYVVLGVFELYSYEYGFAKSDWKEFKDLWNSNLGFFHKCWEFLQSSFVYKLLMLAIGVIFIFFLWSFWIPDFESYVNSILYILNTYDIFLGVIHDRKEIDAVFDVDHVDSIELRMDEYKIISTEYEKFSTIAEVYFLQKFENLLYSGDISGARDYVISNAPNDEIKNILLSAMKDESSVLLKDVGISFVPRCNSFYLKKHDKYASVVSDRGSIVKLSGKSGSGKSTITNSLVGDGKYFPGFINGRPSYLISSESRSVFNYYSEQYIPFFDMFTLRQNLQIADKDVSGDELLYLLSKMSIEKYYQELGYIFSMIRFSHGQYSRILINRLFISLNGIVKKACESISDKSVKDILLKAIVSDDISDEDLSKISGVKLSSFFVILDEPLSVLDHETARRVMDIIKKYTKLGFTFMIIDHSGIVDEYADNIIKIENKTCEYYVKVDDEMVNLNDIEFDQNGIAVVGDSIASLSDYDKISSVGKIKQEYLDDKLKNIRICKINKKRIKTLLNILKEHKLNKIKLDDDKSVKTDITNGESINEDIYNVNEDIDLPDRINRIVIFDDNKVNNTEVLVPAYSY
jgi:ABC-type multidrug transport system ATPase subunit